jgi:hypothetical protein
MFSKCAVSVQRVCSECAVSILRERKSVKVHTKVQKRNKNILIFYVLEYTKLQLVACKTGVRWDGAIRHYRFSSWFA